jgi:hypothetical protein
VVKFRVLDKEHPKYSEVGILHGITTFVETGDTMFILKFDGDRYGSFDSYRLELIR